MNNLKEVFKEDAEKLLVATLSCRDDMHEPDEQGLDVRIVGNKLDNAFGTFINEKPIVQGFQEYVVIFERQDARKYDDNFTKINLANLIALARIGAREILK